MLSILVEIHVLHCTNNKNSPKNIIALIISVVYEIAKPHSSIRCVGIIFKRNKSHLLTLDILHSVMISQL